MDRIQPLAWTAICQRDDESIIILHGRDVETSNRFFVEGVWASSFTGGAIHESDCVFGSGAALAENGVTFVSSTATTDFLYYSITPEEDFCISNSLPLLLALLKDELRPDEKGYSAINASVLAGIGDYRSQIPTREGSVVRLMHRNIYVDCDGWRSLEKPSPPPFSGFTDYNNYLRRRIETLISNARDPARDMPMRIYSTQSKGYDSTAINAIAANFKIDNVFTSPKSKERKSFYMGQSSGNANDDGSSICSVLGMPCIKIDRHSFLAELEDESLYWAGFDTNQDWNLHALYRQMSPPSLLLTGFYGDAVWGRHPDDRGPSNSLVRKDQSGLGLGELRLKKSFVQVAVPYIGARRLTDIARISNSSEMRPWSVGEGYDRPIARRIAEEGGVPRDLFGQVKVAAVVQFPTPNVPIGRELRKKFFRHLRQHGLANPVTLGLLGAVRRTNNLLCWNDPTFFFGDDSPISLLRFLGRFWRRWRGFPLRFTPFWSEIDSYLYSFCVNLAARDYQIALDSQKARLLPRQSVPSN